MAALEASIAAAKSPAAQEARQHGARQVAKAKAANGSAKAKSGRRLERKTAKKS